MFEAVYIADSNDNLIYEYLINLSSPNFKSLISIISSKAKEDKGLIEINNDYSVYLVKTSNIVIYTLTISRINPLLPFTFINRLIEVIYDYFGYPLAIPKIESNNDTLTLLINQMLDDGLPNITDFNQLRDIIPFKSFLSKILSRTNDLTSKAAPSSVTQTKEVSEIPWRRSNVRHTNNEMYVDITETINVILKSSTKKVSLQSGSKQFDSAFYSSSNTYSSSKNLIPVSGNISGKINFTSHLTGVPYLQMILNLLGNKLDTPPRFHPCIKLDNWKSGSGNLSFIPPDGKCTLMNYSIDLNQLTRKAQMTMLGLINIEYNYGLGVNKNEFEIKLYLPIIKGVSKVENITVEINTNAPKITNIKSNRLTHGDFSYKGNSKAEWNVRTLSTGINPVLYGAIITDDMEDTTEESLIQVESNKIVKPSFIRLLYSNKGSLPSGIKVESLKIISAKGLGESVKPYKGVKYLTQTGDYTIRS